jgi:flagella basal body P-ring formation protein FlgA
MKQKMPLFVFAMLFALSGVSVGFGQALARVTLAEAPVKVYSSLITLGQVAKITTTNSRLQQELLKLELDSFDDYERDLSGKPLSVTVTKRQIKYVLMLAGLKENQFELIGASQVLIEEARPGVGANPIAEQIRQQLAVQYFIPAADIQVTLEASSSPLNPQDYSNLKLANSLRPEILLGSQQLSMYVIDRTGQSVQKRETVTVALMRDLVVARQNISKGEIFSRDNVLSVRRPVIDRTAKFASFDQVIGQAVQSNVQQHELIKSSLIGGPTSRGGYLIRRNAKVKIVVRSGSLIAMLPNAKAMDQGNVGDQIAFENPATKKIILAKVVDAFTAEVRY